MRRTAPELCVGNKNWVLAVWRGKWSKSDDDIFDQYKPPRDDLVDLHHIT